MLHVLFLTASSRSRDRVAELLPPGTRLTVASPSTGLRPAPGPDVGLFDMDVGRPAFRRWRRQAPYRLSVVLLVRTEDEKRRALEDDVADVLVWGDLSSPRLRKALRRAARSVSARRSEGRLYESLFRQSPLIQWLVEPGTGRIVDANRAAARFYAYEPSRLARLRIADVNELPPGAIADKMQQAVHEEQNHFTFRHQTATGERKDVQVRSYPVQTARGPLLFSTIRPIDPAATDSDEALRVLSPREREIFNLLAEGKAVEQIVEDLFLARGTVKNHLSRIYRKLGVSSRAEAIYWAARRDLLR